MTEQPDEVARDLAPRDEQVDHHAGDVARADQPDDQSSRPERAEKVQGTGDADIDAALAELDAVRDQPLEAHIAAAERVHAHLQSRLSDLGDW